MAIAVSLVGVVVVLLGVAIAVVPERFLGTLASLESRPRFAIAVGVRVAMGVLFLLAAPACQLPTVVRVIGVIALVAAGGLLLMGRARMDAFVAWWLELPTAVLRSWSVVAIAFGALLVYAGGA
ncbi:MAG: hypothetical protein MJE66_21840 [Proteobacteria bacterium]|nr:hypothetical protein [Pseudomonadota bacterium]